MFSAIKSAYYSKTIKKVDEQEKALEPSPHASAAVEPSAKQGTSDSNPTTLVGDGSSLVTSIENIPGSFPSDEEESMVEKGEKFWSSQLEKEISKKIMAEKDTIQARSTQSWFPEVSTKGYREADMPDVAKSSPVFAQVGNYGPPTENKTQKGTGGKNAQKNLNPAVPVKLFPLVSNTDHHGNTTISPSAPFQFCNQGPGVNSTAPWPVKPLPWFRGLFESNAPDPVISSAISTQTDIHGPMENKAQSGPIFAKPAFPWYPETSNTSNDKISGSNRSGLSSKPTQGVREEPETTPSPFPLLKTTGPVILPAWLPHPILSNSTNQGPPADSSSQPLKSPPVKSTAAPLFVSSSFSFDLSRHSRASVTPQPHTDTTPATPIFNSSTMAPPFISPIGSSSFPPRTLFMPEPLSSMGQDKVLECNSGGIFPKSAIPTLANSGAESILEAKTTSAPQSSRPSYKQKALHEFRPRDICHPYAENMRTSAETPRPPVEAILPSAEKQILPTVVEAILPSAEKQIFPTAVEAILPSAEKQIFPTNTRYQPSAKEIRSPGADAQHGNVKHWNQPEKLASSERPVTASVDPHKASTEPINKKVSAMAARWMKMTEQEVCVDLMELISSRVSLMQYQSLVSIIAELYSQPHISLDLFEVKVYDIMKRILHWFSRELKLNVAMSNRFLPTGFHFTSFLYWENKTLQIILSVSCIESISYVEVLILGDLGHGPNNLFLIGEYTLKERGPVPVSTKQHTLMGERSILRTACGLFGACKNPECKTVLGRVTSQLGKMKYNEGSPPDSVDIELFCENSILLQKARDAGEENTDAPKRLRKREDPAWKAFVRRRRNYENAILDGVDEGPTTAESVKAVEIRGDTEDPESPYSSSPDDKTKELLEKMKEQFSLSAASARKIRKGLAAAKATQNRCEGSLSKMAGTIKKSAEPSNSNIPEKGSNLQDKFTTTVITGRRRAATVFVEGVEFIMENPRWPRSSEPMLGTEFNFTIEDAEDEDDEYEDGDEDEEVVQEKEQAQHIPEPIQKQGANKGKNKSKKKGKKGKNNWKRL